VVLIDPEMNVIPPAPAMILLLIAVASFVIAMLLMAVLYDTERKLEKFDAYKAEFDKQWGAIEEKDLG
jgi:hypothetical protein